MTPEELEKLRTRAVEIQTQVNDFVFYLNVMLKSQRPLIKKNKNIEDTATENQILDPDSCAQMSTALPDISYLTSFETKDEDYDD